jgi:NAD(P)-dependent dehydrogenase (short-subunit alcohol dehydrogenase family)
LPIVDFGLEGRVATINGASRGIGESIARAFAERGATVVLSSRRQDALNRVAESIRAAGGKAIAIACHGGKADQIEALFRRVDSELGRLDIHVNNAGTNPYFGLAMGTPLPAFDKTVEVNLRGYLLMIQHAAPLMERSGGGSIINVTSIAGLAPQSKEAAYAITKTGVISLTKSFARELGPKGIRVNAIAPGVIETRFSEAVLDTEEKRRHWREWLPAGRHGQPADIAGAAVYLASSASAYCTGHTLVVDGGALVA